MDTWLVLALVALAAIVFFHDKIAYEFRTMKQNPKRWLKRMWKEWGEPFLIAALIAIVIRSFVLGPYKIPTGSMRPTLLEGDRIFVDKITYRFKVPERGDIVVFKYPEDPKKDFVKRLIAFGGEEVEIREGSVYVNGERLTEPAVIEAFYYYNRSDWNYGKKGQIIHVPEGSFFVLGDNSGHSSDSRNWGFVPMKSLIGRAFLIWWPLNRFGFAH